MDQLRPVSDAMIGRLEIAADQEHLDVASGTGEPGLTVATARTDGACRAERPRRAEMLDVAARRAEALGIANVETRVCSADDLPFDDATFDSVSVRFGYMFLPDLAGATAEFARVLRPGGRLVRLGVDQARRQPVDVARACRRSRRRWRCAPPDPDGPGMFRCAGPGYVSALYRGRRAARRRGVGRRRRARDPSACRVLGHDERACLARGRRAREGRRSGARADRGQPSSTRSSALRAGRHGTRPGDGALHRRHGVGTDDMSRGADVAVVREIRPPTSSVRCRSGRASMTLSHAATKSSTNFCLRVVAGVDLGERAQLRVRAEDEVDAAAGPLHRTGRAVATLERRPRPRTTASTSVPRSSRLTKKSFVSVPGRVGEDAERRAARSWRRARAGRRRARSSPAR